MRKKCTPLNVFLLVYTAQLFKQKISIIQNRLLYSLKTGIQQIQHLKFFLLCLTFSAFFSISFYLEPLPDCFDFEADAGEVDVVQHLPPVEQEGRL